MTRLEEYSSIEGFHDAVRTPYAQDLASMLVSFCTRQYTEKETNMADLEMVTKE